MCVHDREGVSQEGTKNLHRYKERERDMYAIVEARVCGCINLSCRCKKVGAFLYPFTCARAVVATQQYNTTSKMSG